MRILPFQELRAGDVLAANLYGANGQMVLRQGSVLEGHHLQLLDRKGYRSIPVEMAGFEGVQPAPWVDEMLLQQFVSFLYNLPAHFDPDAARVARTMANTLRELAFERRNSALELLTVLGADTAAAVVAVNRALVVASVALEHIDTDHLLDAIVAALLLDAGPGNALGQRAVDDPDDPADLQHQSAAAIAYVDEMGHMPAFVMATLRQVYAHWDGSGLPPLQADDIWQGAQIMAPANKIARLLVETGQHPAVAPHEALEWVMGGAGTEYALPWLTRIQRRVAPYGVGTAVRLSTGHVGVVTHVPLGSPGRAHVRILDPQGGGQVWDLQDRAYRNVAVVGIETSRDLLRTHSASAAT